MIKIALINPYTDCQGDRCEPLQLGYLAAFLKQRKVTVKIIDEAAGDDVNKELDNFAPEYVGVTATTPVVNRAYEIISYCKNKGYKTIIGGVHASTMPEEAVKYADYVVVGEGELALFSIIDKDLSPGIVKYPYIEKIDDIPYPDRSLMNMEFYLHQDTSIPVNVHYFLPDETRIASLVTSRGCPFECIFCHNSWRGTPVRYHGAERVFNEIKELKAKYDVGGLFFRDDDFFANKPRLLDICSRLHGARLNLIWTAAARVSSIDKEVLDAAYQAGCRQINYGIETGSQKVLNTLNKKTTVKQAQESIELTKKAGIMVFASFMIGSPGETLEDMKLTKDFILKNHPDSFYVGITTPYPGTALWQWCKSANLVEENITWDNFTWADCEVAANELFNRKQIEWIRFRIFLGSMLRMNLKFLWFNMKYIFRNPLYFISRFVKHIKPYF